MRGKGKEIAEMNKECMRRETRNGKDIGDDVHDRKNKTGRQVYGRSEKETERRGGQCKQRFYNITATSWHKTEKGRWDKVKRIHTNTKIVLRARDDGAEN